MNHSTPASLSITNSWSLPKLMSIKLVMPSNHLILCCPLLLLSSVFPSIRVFSNESVLRIRWPNYWSFSFNISPTNEHPGLISFRMDWLDLFAVQGTLKSSPKPQFKSINSSALSFLYSPTLTSIHDYWMSWCLTYDKCLISGSYYFRVLWMLQLFWLLVVILSEIKSGSAKQCWIKIGKGVHQGCIFSPCLFNFYAEYIMRNAGLDEAQNWNQDCWEKHQQPQICR